jgi:hypothetical protein
MASSFPFLKLMWLPYVGVIAVVAARVAFRRPLVKGDLLLYRRWLAGGVGVCWCTRIKAVVLGFFRTKTEIYLLSALIDLEGLLSCGRLRRRTSLGASCLEFTESDGIRSCATMFFLTD